MKKEIVYVCEFCGAKFDNPSDCLDCERSHAVFEAFDRKRRDFNFVHNIYHAGDFLPYRTVAAFSSGDYAVYDRVLYSHNDVIASMVKDYYGTYADCIDNPNDENDENVKRIEKKILDYIEEVEKRSK